MLTKKTYKLWLRTGVNETGLADDAAILAAIAAILLSNLTVQNLVF
jgi:hypothetical protein